MRLLALSVVAVFVGSEPAFAQDYNARWDRTDGGWTTGWVRQTPATYGVNVNKCGHFHQGCTCGQVCGWYPSGAVTRWWPQGCSGPMWTIRCTVIPAYAHGEGPTCTLASVWSATVSELGQSTWTISDDGTAVEQGLGNARGRATLSGKTLTIQWRAGEVTGDYVVSLNDDCSAGTGQVRWLSGPVPRRTFETTFKRQP